MANSASDPKVEDVLSSVRRLVSGDIPRKARSPLPEGPGALVLTDAHRVAKDPLSRRSKRSLEDRIAELEAAVDDGVDEFEPDGSEDQKQNVPDRIVYTRPPSKLEVATARRSTLRLSEIAVLESQTDDEGAGDAANDTASVQFRHDKHDKRERDRDVDQAKSLIGDNGPPADNPEIEPFAPPPQPIHGGLSEASDSFAEAPMVEDVPTIRTRTQISPFINPDEVVERIEARFDRGGEDEVREAPIGAASEPDASDTRAEARENMLREDVDPDKTSDADDDFDEALSQAVEASVTSAVFEEPSDGVPEEMAEPEDTIVLPDDAPVSEMEDIDLEAAGMAELVADPIPAAENADVSEFSEVPEEAVDDTPPLEPVATEEVAREEIDGDGDHENDNEEAEEPLIAAGSIDEAALQVLVARLIREELQGDLGERITRNVRKLVRREIKRALEARDII